MFFGNTVEETRLLFFTSWHKYRNNQILSPLEQQLVNVIILHPEYHALLNQQTEEALSKNYLGEIGFNNPFLHMGLHLAIRDQIAMDKPAGITTLFNKLKKKYKEGQIVEHKMMECLTECLFISQRDHCPPNESAYLLALTKL